MATWPKDNEAALIAYYGEPGPEVEAQLVPVVPPYKMTYEGSPVSKIMFHRKAAPYLLAALTEIWDRYGHDQARIDAAHLNIYDGAYNHRKIAGSNKWSNHAFGAAVDLDAKDNAQGTGHGDMPQIAVDAFKRQGWRWGGDYTTTTDPMHFEACGGGTIPDTAPTPLPPVPEPSPSLPTLKKGDKGPDVVKLQQLLVDGDFGTGTELTVRNFQTASGLVADGVVGPYTWQALLKTPPPPSPVPPGPPPAISRQMAITATVFGGASDPNDSAYTGRPLGDHDFYIALPDRFEGTRPMVRLFKGSLVAAASIEDVGPWNTDDPYWTTGTRPQAESGTDMSGRTTNKAGIDLSPALAKALELDGMGLVDWEFVTTTPITVTEVVLAPDQKDWRDFDLWGWFKSLFKRS